jgi:Flp pilus assembly protein TadB
MSDENSNKQSHTAIDEVNLQTEMAKAQVEIAKIEAATNARWQTVLTTLADMWEKHEAQKASGERRYTDTLTISILAFLVIIVGVLSALTWRGSVSGDSLIFFLGTLAGSVLMLVAERIKTQR